jgi:hypothetical protein
VLDAHQLLPDSSREEEDRPTRARTTLRTPLYLMPLPETQDWRPVAAGALIVQPRLVKPH